MFLGFLLFFSSIKSDFFYLFFFGKKRFFCSFFSSKKNDFCFFFSKKTIFLLLFLFDKKRFFALFFFDLKRMILRNQTVETAKGKNRETKKSSILWSTLRCSRFRRKSTPLSPTFTHFLSPSPLLFPPAWSLCLIWRTLRSNCLSFFCCFLLLILMYCIVPWCSVTLATPPSKQMVRYESNKPIKSKLAYRQSINQSKGIQWKSTLDWLIDLM